MIKWPLFQLVIFILISSGCQKMDRLPSDAIDYPLMLTWMEDNTIRHYQVGKTALFSRSFVLLNPEGFRIFVYDFYITRESIVRFSIISEEAIEDVETDLERTLENGREVPFNAGQPPSPGTVSLEFIENNHVYRNSNISQNSEKRLKILDVKKINLSQKHFFEATILFECFIENLQDNSISEIRNGQGRIAFRYK